MFSAGDARRYPGFFTRTWTPPPENIGHVRSNRSASSIQGGLTHETPPLLTPRLAAPINVRGLAATDSIPRLNNPLPSPTGLLTNSALVGMSREEPSIMPLLSSKQTAPMGMHPTIFAGRRGLADMSEEERMEYTNRLEGDMTHVHNTLSRAYQLRDDYKNEAARLHRELQDKNHRFDCLLREHSACNDVIYRCKRENEELRQKLDESEGEVRQLRDKLVPVNSQGKYVPSGDERHVGRQEISALEEKNKKLEEELLELTKELERERECIRHHAVAAEMRKSENTSHEEELAQSRYLLQVTRTEITDLQQLLRKEREDYEESLREAVQARNNLHQQNTALQEQKEQLQEMCDEQHRTIEDLTSQLLQRKTEQAVQRGAPDTQMETTDENKTDTNRNNDDEVYRMLELQQHTLQQQFFLLRREGEAKDILLQKASEEIFNLQNLQQQLEAALQKSREHVAELTKSLSHTQNQLQTAQERITEDSYVINNFHHQLREKIQISGSISGEKNIPQGGNKEESIELVTRETQMPSRSGNDSQYITANVQHEKLNLPQKADSGHNATGNNKELSSAQNDECEQAIIKHKMTEEGLTEVIEALKTELQHTQKCLREAEEENVQLTNKLNAVGVRGRSTSTTRSGSLTQMIQKDH
ncbi:NUP-1 protein [Trypanosoma brucei equiperdum]|uniref:NUP-1 protein n=1 Tax=Trypanosoma brucei equiperdum TaxID=630700 RepID=A0A3L6LED8_9TRYP|nr:NUP-1 protein [Trypanosoma brucei equiperdum]